MHFVTGGAFNGKRKWVITRYPDGKWVSAYKGEALVEDLNALHAATVVLEGLEAWVKELSFSREKWRSIISGWRKWEQQAPARQVIVIGTDISKGIVPIEKENRSWRDQTGWVYQDMVVACERVDMIWYGINQRIKG